ncbi:MAG: iron-containing alcohol dehydrogenase, partial [Salinisphaeraceae bacterium]|nr:iron-containing alcohol dehydrogenase [Salinisphaeraceae bacterium]
MIPFAIEVFFLRCYAFLLKIAVRILPMPSPLVFAGPGSRLQLCATIASTDVKNLLVVTDAMLNKLGLLDDMLAELEKRGVNTVVYDGIEPDPTVAQIEAGFDMLKANNCEAVLAVGGGSPIDAAKVIAALPTNNKPIVKMAGLFKVRKPLLPLYVVPTTAGTGSEVSVGAVVTDV